MVLTNKKRNAYLPAVYIVHFDTTYMCCNFIDLDGLTYLSRAFNVLHDFHMYKDNSYVMTKEPYPAFYKYFINRMSSKRDLVIK